ncbi:MAG: cupin domain-containing protein [Myxococcota bacterium]|nr:cupin domain-containing protein [Myxococcota bacterium]
MMTFCTSVWASPKANGAKYTITSSDNLETRGLTNGKAKIQRLAQGKNAFIGRLWLAPSARVPLHKDPTEEYLVIVSGAGEMTIDGQTIQVSAGMTIYMPAGAEVSFVNGPDPLVAIQVFSGPEAAAKYGKWPVLNSDRALK